MFQIEIVFNPVLRAQNSKLQYFQSIINLADAFFMQSREREEIQTTADATVHFTLTCHLKLRKTTWNLTWYHRREEKEIKKPTHMTFFQTTMAENPI